MSRAELFILGDAGCPVRRDELGNLFPLVPDNDIGVVQAEAPDGIKSMGLKRTSCSTLARDDFILVPRPAARTTALIFFRSII